MVDVAGGECSVSENVCRSMELSFTGLAVMIALALALFFWRDALRQRDRANAAAMEACERLSLQFLDGTAAFARWRVQRDSGGWALRRVFVFDYTAQSIERRQGFVVMLAGRVESVGFANADDARSRPAPTTVNISMTFGAPTSSGIQPSAMDPSIVPPPANPPANVLDLDEWRRTHPERNRLH